MVSLGSNRSPGGGFFFNPEGSNLDDTDDESLISNVLFTDSEPRFKTFTFTGWGVLILQMLGVVAMVFCPFMIIHFVLDPCFYLYVTHVVIWCIMFLTACNLNYFHNTFKRCGYLEFHRKTRTLFKLPFITLSFGNGLLLVFGALLHKFCSGFEVCPSDSHMRCYDYILIIYVTEFIILFPISIKYLIIVLRFCHVKNVPDVHHDELLISCIHSHSPPHEIGFKEEDYREEILERQADMIRYLKQHNAHLSRKILKLSTELTTAKVSAVRA